MPINSSTLPIREPSLPQAHHHHRTARHDRSGVRQRRRGLDGRHRRHRRRDPTATDSSGPAATEAVPTDAAAAFPVTVTHALGSTTIESEPQRVVTVGVTEQDTVLAVGVTPVGVTDWYGDQPYATWPWAQDELGDAQPEVLLAPRRAATSSDRRARARPDHRHERRARRGVVRDAVGDRSDDRPSGRLAALLRAVGRSGSTDRGGARPRSEEMEAVIADIDAQFAAAAGPPIPSSRASARSSCRTPSTTTMRSPIRKG